MAIAEDGTVYVWGRDADGQLGIPNPAANITSPQRVTALTNVSSIAAGWYTSYAASRGTRLDGYAWGSNSNGQIGNGTAGGDVQTPTRIVIP
jgi:alpha-tubulin suppressor-like RCC1 family protein